MKNANNRQRTFMCVPAALLTVLLLLLAGTATAAAEPVFTKKDCTCSGFSLPPYTDAFLTDAPQNGYYALTCQYGGYADIPSAAKGKGVQFDLHKESAEGARGEYADRQKVILPVFEGVKNDKKRHLIEYIPPGPAYISLLYTYPSTSSKSTVHNGQRAIIYKTKYYIFVSGIGYDLAESDLKSMMDSAESCAKAIADAKEGGTPADQETIARLVVLGGEVTLNGRAVDPREGGVVLKNRDLIETSSWLSPGWGYLMYTDRTLLRVEPGSKFVYHPDWIDLNLGGLWYRADKVGQKFQIKVWGGSTTPRGTTYAVQVAPDGTANVYVYDGEVAFSDTGNTKTVTVSAGQNASCSKGGVPSDPRPFDQNAVDRWWERGPPVPADAAAAAPVTTPKKSPASGPASAALAVAALLWAGAARKR